MANGRPGRPRKPLPKPPKRKRGTGSVAHHKPSGRWRARLPGAEEWTWHATREAAEGWLNAELERRANAAAGKPSSRTPLVFWLAHWFAVTSVSSDWAESTRTTYRRYLAYFESIGAIPLAELTLDHIQAVVAKLLEIGPDRPPIDPKTGRKTQRVTPLSPFQAGAALGALRRALEYARDNGLISSNPARLAVSPKVRRVMPSIWTAEELAKLLPHFRGDKLEALWLLSLTCGLRIGELLGLKWTDFDRPARMLTIQRTRFRDGRVQDWPKSRRPRTIGLSDEAFAALLRHRERQHPGAEWVFEHNFGALRVWSYDGVLSRLKLLCTRAGVPYHGTHTGRHHHATHLLALGIPPADVAERLGHADASVTLRVYFQSTREGRQRAIDAADGLLQLPPPAGVSGEDS